VSDSRVVGGPRMVRDRKTGEMISVVERRADGIAGARNSHCLVFSSERGFRRLWDYPRNWMEFGDDELIALSERRSISRSQSA
jgi:hypothetical protein